MSTANKRIIAAALVLMILTAVLPAAIAASSFQAVVTSASMKVYQQKSPYRYIGSLPRGTTVTVKACSGQAALISYNGRTGIARKGDMTAVADVVRATATPEPMETVTSAEQAAAKSVVTNRATRVYLKPSKSAKYVSIKAGTPLSLLAVSGSVAKVSSGSLVGYMTASHLTDPNAASPEPTATPAPTAQATGTAQKYDRVAVVTTDTARVYSKPSTSSSYKTVAKGTSMDMLAVKGNCAMVEKNGRVGYVLRSLLTTETQETAVATPTPAPTTAAITGEIRVDDDETYTGTNEEIIFKFLTQSAGYNTAAACGIMANIKYESGYKPANGGDSGTSYGIVQWHGARKTRLINWCSSSGYDYKTLKGQLNFLKYELKRYYPAVHNRLVAVPNTEQGAYDAGYDFCFSYEAPSNRASKSVTRGNYAKTTLWKRYKV